MACHLDYFSFGVLGAGCCHKPSMSLITDCESADIATTAEELPCISQSVAAWIMDFTWFLAAVLTMDINTGSGSNIGHRHKPGFSRHHRAQTSTRPWVVTQTAGISTVPCRSLTSGGSTGHGH